jgi:glycosyltransferase involved in cell wall biosynthesis
VVNEALAYGLPVITTDRCGAGLEMIKEGINGYVIHHMGEDNLRVRLDELLNTPELCEQMSNANIGLAHQYTIEKMAEKHIEIFSEILSKRQ